MGVLGKTFLVAGGAVGVGCILAYSGGAAGLAILSQGSAMAAKVGLTVTDFTAEMISAGSQYGLHALA